MNWTPGPWEISSGEDGAAIFEPDSGTVAQVPIDLCGWESNARLIAAAPEMVALLARVEPFCPVAAQDAIRALLARIEGRAK